MTRRVERCTSGTWETVPVPADRAEVETEFYRAGQRYAYRIVEGRRVVYSIRRVCQVRQWIEDNE